MPARHLLAAVVAASLLAPTAAHAGFGDVLWSSLPADHQPGDRYGVTVVADGSYALVGSLAGGANDTPAVYVIEPSTGSVLRKLADPNPKQDDWFGSVMAIDEGIAVVGDWYDSAAYVFDVATGSLLHELRPPGGGEANSFGFDVALDAENGLIAIGDLSRGQSAPDSFAGGAYVFRLATGEQVLNVTGTDGSRSGDSLALDNGLLAVGSVRQSDPSVNLFTAATGVPRPGLLATEGTPIRRADHLAADDGLLALVDASTVKVFDFATGREVSFPSRQLTAAGYGLPFAKAVAFEAGILYLADSFASLGSAIIGVAESVGTAVYAFDAATGLPLTTFGAQHPRIDGFNPPSNRIAVIGETLLLGTPNLVDGDTFLAIDVSLDMAGDFNDDGVVDAADYTMWRDAAAVFAPYDPIDPAHDSNNDGRIDALDYNVWVHTFGDTNALSATVPEPAAVALAAVGLLVAARRR